jgi:elongation factor Ts
MDLRKATGLGMMECKKALTESGGDLDAAVELLRKKGLAKAAKKAGREAKEGLIKIHKIDDRHGAMLVVNCETDFVARNDDFRALVEDLAAFFAAAEVPPQCVGGAASAEHIDEQIKGMAYKGHTVGEELTAAVAKIGENIQLGNIVLERSEEPGDYLQEYLHGNRVGVLVCLTTGKPETHQDERFIELAHDLAMQVAAAMPRVAEAVDRDGLDPALVEKEKEILTEQAKAEGKPPEIAEKMVMGRINKFFGEVCLVDQPYIRDDKKHVKEIIKAAEQELGDTIKVARFHRFELGG